MHRRGLTAGIVLSSGLTSLPTTALVLAVPAIHQEFHASISALQWTLTAYSLAYSAFLVIGGRLADLLGRMRLFELGVAGWVAGTIAAALAPDALTLILAMGLLGVASAALTPASLALLTATWSGARRTRAISSWALASSLISSAGPTLGGVITADLSWRWIFWLCAAVSVLTLALATLGHARDARLDEAARIDVSGAALLLVGLTSLSLALIQGPEWEFDSAPTIAVFAAGAVALAWFVGVERRKPSPLLELSLFRVPQFIGGVVVKLALNFALSVFFLFVSLYLQEVLGYTAEQAGWGLLPFTLPFLLAVPVGTRLGERIGPRVPILTGLTLAIVAFAWLTTIDKNMHYTDVLPAIVLLIGAGLVVTPMNAVPMNAIPQRQHGEAAAILSMTTGLGAVLGIAGGGAIFQEMHERRLTDYLRATEVQAISEPTQHRLTGVLVHSPPAERALARFDADSAAVIVRGLRVAFVYAVSSTMVLSASVLFAAAVAAIALMRGGSLTASS